MVIAKNVVLVQIPQLGAPGEHGPADYMFRPRVREARAACNEPAASSMELELR